MFDNQVEIKGYDFVLHHTMYPEII